MHPPERSDGSDHQPGRTRRAVFITATEPEPRRYGKPVVIGGILDHLCARLGPENVHLILIGRSGLARPTVSYTVTVLPKPGPLDQARSVLRCVILPPRGTYRRSFQEAALHSGELKDALHHTLAQIDADLEIWDTVRLGQYVADGTIAHRVSRRMLYADDLFSERYAAMLEQRDGVGNPGGEFVKLLPGPAKALLASPLVHRPLLRLERALVSGSEERQPAHFDGTYLISSEETARLRARIPDAAIGTLPPLLRESPPLVRSYDGAREFTFLGGFDYAPNVDGIDWFLRTCREAVQAAVPGVTINIVGTGTEQGLRSATEWGPQVRFLGWVDDLGSVLGRSAALLSPLQTGSGLKIKVLEALARGLPVVATPAGIQGIDQGARAGCVIAATPGELASAMASVTEPAFNARLSAAARDAWNRCFAPSVVQRAYDEIFGLSASGTGEPQPSVPSALA